MPESTQPSNDEARPNLSLEEADRAVSQIGRLKPGNPVRRMSVALLRGSRVDSVQPLIHALLDPAFMRWREREVAAWALGAANVSPEERDASTSALLDVLEGSRRESRWRPLGRALVAPFAAALPVALVVAITISLQGHPWDRGDWLRIVPAMAAMYGLIALPVVAPLEALYESTRLARVRAAAASALGHLRTPESVGPLAAALFDRSDLVRGAAVDALHESLPSLTEDQYGLLGAKSIVAMGKALSHADSGLVAKLLAALAKVGTGHAAPYVERLAERGRTMRLRDSAHNVLAVLRERARREQESDRLLRPAQGSATPPDRLVRPSEQVQESEAVRTLGT